MEEMENNLENVETEVTESVEQVENTENTAPNTEEQQTEEVTGKTFTQSELDSIIQKRIDRERKTFQNNPDLAFINELAKSYGFNSTDEYREAVKKQQEQDKVDQEKRDIDDLVKQNIPLEYATEMMENKKFRERYEHVQKEEQSNQQLLNEFNELATEVEGIKNAEDIKPEVMQLRDEKGISLLDAYNRIEIKNLRENQETIKQQVEQETIKKINQNAISPGSAASGNVDHATKYANMNDEDFAKQVVLAKQGML